jgi:hypothetical protein
MLRSVVLGASVRNSRAALMASTATAAVQTATVGMTVMVFSRKDAALRGQAPCEAVVWRLIDEAVCFNPLASPGQGDCAGRLISTTSRKGKRSAI